MKLFFKWAIAGLFLDYFWSFQTNINKILQQINVKKCPSSIWHWYLNPQPLEHEYPPITTSPVAYSIKLFGSLNYGFVVMAKF